MLNIVAIVGKTKVGKSTLFNRFTRQSSAIVDSMPNVTRDRHYDVAEWCGYTFTLIDTGGYIQETKDDISRQINEQAEIAMDESLLVLFLVDCKTSITKEDIALAERLRKSDKPVIVVANKADNLERSIDAADFYALGLGNVHEISATHGSGTGDLLDVIVSHFQVTEVPQQWEGVPHIALVGRTNTGKSTFLNVLLGTNRSIVTPQQHTTRVPNHSYYRLYNRECILIDTAGLAKKSKISNDSIEFYALIRTIKAIEKADVCIVFADAREGITQQDKKILTLAHRKKKGIVLLVNKSDLLDKDMHLEHDKKRLQAELGFLHYVPILYTSGLYKKNIYQSMTKALEVYENIGRSVSTSRLNKIIEKAFQQQSPPAVRGKQVKVSYAMQLPKPFPMFLLFCNRPDQLPAHYKRYLEKKIRLAANFEGVPISFSFRKKS